MATGVLEEFRRFVAAAVRRNLRAGLAEANGSESLRATDAIVTNDRVLMFGSQSLEVLKACARKAGPGSAVINVDDDPVRVVEARNAIAAAGDTGAEAAIRVLCAGPSDLRTDLEWVASELRTTPVNTLTQLFQFEEALAFARRNHPLVRDGSVTFAILPLLNRLPSDLIPPFLQEVFRSLADGGRIMLTCLVADEPVAFQNEPLSSQCRSIPTEQQMLEVLEEAGFYGIEINHWDQFPRHVVGAAEIRSIEVRAFKGKQGPCYEGNQAVVYRGPWKRVHDDDGHAYTRGERTAVCEKTFHILTSEPYRSDFIPIPPYVPVPVASHIPFDCHGSIIRDPKITKGRQPTEPGPAVEQCRTDCAC